MMQRRKFSIRRNGTKRWRYAQTGVDSEKAEELSVIIHKTTLDLDMQKFAVEVSNQALDLFKIGMFAYLPF